MIYEQRLDKNQNTVNNKIQKQKDLKVQIKDMILVSIGLKWLKGTSEFSLRVNWRLFQMYGKEAEKEDLPSAVGIYIAASYLCRCCVSGLNNSWRAVVWTFAKEGLIK